MVKDKFHFSSSRPYEYPWFISLTLTDGVRQRVDSDYDHINIGLYQPMGGFRGRRKSELPAFPLRVVRRARCPPTRAREGRLFSELLCLRASRAIRRRVGAHDHQVR